MMKKIPVTLTEEQYKIIAEQAEMIGLGIAPYMRMIVMEKIRVNEALDAQKTLVQMIKAEAFKEK